jgi:hypothetical protein
VRQSPRHGEGADIHQGFNAVRLQSRYKLIERAGGVTDGVEGCHGRRVSASVKGRQRRAEVSILLGENCAQVEQHTSVFDARDYGRS